MHKDHEPFLLYQGPKKKKELRRGIGRAVVAWGPEVGLKSVGEHQKPLGRIEMF